MQNTQDSRVPINFEQGRGYEPIGVGLPDNFLAGEPDSVLKTLAVLFTSPDPQRINKPCQAVAMLAMYAAGAQVDLTDAQYRQLDRAAEEYQSQMRCSQWPRHAQPRNEAFAAYIRRQAAARRQLSDSLPFSARLATLNFEVGRCFGPVGVGLPANFLDGDPLHTTAVLAFEGAEQSAFNRLSHRQLTTLAFLYTHPNPMRCNSWGQALAVLALYGAGAQVSLEPEQYRWLDDQVEEYESIMRSSEAPQHAQAGNEAFAAYIRRHGRERAREDRLL